VTHTLRNPALDHGTVFLQQASSAFGISIASKGMAFRACYRLC